MSIETLIEPDESDPKFICKSCGVPFTDHLGLQGTCERLQSAQDEIRRLKVVLGIIMKWHGAFPSIHWTTERERDFMRELANDALNYQPKEEE